jgi:hypothetical protein
MTLAEGRKGPAAYYLDNEHCRIQWSQPRKRMNQSLFLRRSFERPGAFAPLGLQRLKMKNGWRFHHPLKLRASDVSPNSGVAHAIGVKKSKL